MATEPFDLKVWRVHPQAGRVVPAERTLNGTADKNGLKFCGPYTYANKSGFWLFPPVDIDICWKGGKEFDVRFLEEYDDTDYHTLRNLLLPKDNITPDKWCMEGGRTKYTWGMVEDGVIQMWTGNIFETPPGWCIHIRSPINCQPRPCYVMEGVLETDWMQQDIWTNIVFTRPGEWVEFRKDGWPPLAQLQVVRREGFAEKWGVTAEDINRDSPEANRVFEYWVQFNQKKFGSGGKQALTPDLKYTKDSTAFWKEKSKCIGAEMEPKAVAPAGCPFHKAERKVVAYVVNDNPRYDNMCLNSVRMLRQHNKDIPIRVFYIGDWSRFADAVRSLDVQVVPTDPFRPEEKYFPINKQCLKGVEEDSVLYLDNDTFINGDVGLLFDKYRTQFTAVESLWVYQRGWKEDFLPNKCRPHNSGVQLFHGGFHRMMYSLLSATYDRLSGHDTPLCEWSWAYSEGWVREELACSLILAESGVYYDYFKPCDVYNIQRLEDVHRCHEPVILHSYTNQWDMVRKLYRSSRKMVWNKKSISANIGASPKD